MHPVTRALFATAVALFCVLVQAYLREKHRGPPPFV